MPRITEANGSLTDYAYIISVGEYRVMCRLYNSVSARKVENKRCA